MIPVAVPSLITAALRPGEIAELDTDTGEWSAVGLTRRPLGVFEGSSAKLRPLTRADANALQSRARDMGPADLDLLDEMRRFYEGRRCAS